MQSRSRRYLRRIGGFWIALAVLLVAARIALPFAIERYLDRVLARDPVYVGHVGDVDVALWRGAYAIDDVVIEKRSGRVPVPLFAAERVDLSILWSALFRGALVAEIDFEAPRLNVVRGRGAATRQTGAETDWRRTVEELFPLRIDRVTARRGEVHYRDFHADPQVDVHVGGVQLELQNLTNSRDIAESRVATVSLDGVPMGQGRVSLSGDFDPLRAPPTFDVDLTVRGAALTQWNDFLRAYAGFDVEAGTFELYAELQADGGRFEGYVKPFFTDVDVLRFEEERDEQSLFASLWEAIVGTAAEVLEDQEHDRQATRIPIAGTTTGTKLGFWPALGSALRNAFFEALVPSLENSVGG